MRQIELTIYFYYLKKIIKIDFIESGWFFFVCVNFMKIKKNVNYQATFNF